ncbi:MAG: hypothetical protein K1W05_04875, partial [Desulfovibrio sp.]
MAGALVFCKTRFKKESGVEKPDWQPSPPGPGCQSGFKFTWTEKQSSHAHFVLSLRHAAQPAPRIRKP